MTNGPKLTITRGAYRGAQADFSGAGAQSLTVEFNPTEYTQNATNSYAEAAIPGLDAPLVQFGRGEAETLSLELLLDTHTYGNDADIRTAQLAKLEALLAVDGHLHAPPPCRVVWGSLVFVGVLTEMQRRFVLFLANGRPVRARVTLSFKQYVPIELQMKGTPRSSPDRRQSRRVVAGERLDQISFEAYGDPRFWRRIAAANGIDDPLAIAPGRLLSIPALEPGALP